MLATIFYKGCESGAATYPYIDKMLLIHLRKVGLKRTLIALIFIIFGARMSIIFDYQSKDSLSS